ncbi:MAG: DUF2207 domain-containing protein [Planctomycetes bacterium]|nr:DUF2207 domain-containing protein [Planctomycetota bacterium]
MAVTGKIEECTDEACAGGVRQLLFQNFSKGILVAFLLLAGCDGSKSAGTQPATAGRPEPETQTSLASQAAIASQSAPADMTATASRPRTLPATVESDVKKPSSVPDQPGPSRTAPASAEKPDVKPPPQTAAAKPPDEKPAGPERILALDVQISIGPYGVLDVTETYRIFSEGKVFRRGLTRELPRPPDDDSHKVPPQISLTVLDASMDGKAAKWQMKNHGRFRWIFITAQDDDAALGNGEHVFVIKYQVDGQIAPDSRLEELVWTATGNWPFATDRISVSIKPPGKPASRPASAPVLPDEFSMESAADESSPQSAKTPASSSAASPASSSTGAAGRAATSPAVKPPAQKKSPPLYEGKVVSGGKEKTFQPLVQADGSILFQLSGPLKKGDWLVIVVRYPPPSSRPAETPAATK